MGEFRVADGWDEAKCREHVNTLRIEADQAQHTATALRDAADGWEREASRKSSQILYCLDTFGKPKPNTPSPTNDSPRERAAETNEEGLT